MIGFGEPSGVQISYYYYTEVPNQPCLFGMGGAVDIRQADGYWNLEAEIWANVSLDLFTIYKSDDLLVHFKVSMSLQSPGVDFLVSK